MLLLDCWEFLRLCASSIVWLTNAADGFVELANF